VKSVHGKVVGLRHSLAYTIRVKWLVGQPLLFRSNAVSLISNWPRWSEITDFRATQP